MRRYHAVFSVVLISLGVLAGSCKKDESTPMTPPQQQGLSLTANPHGVSLTGTTSQNVTISGGTHPYTATSGNPGLATAQFVDADHDTSTLVITGVSTATGSTSVVVRDASNPQRSVTIGVTKTQ